LTFYGGAKKSMVGGSAANRPVSNSTVRYDVGGTYGRTTGVIYAFISTTSVNSFTNEERASKTIPRGLSELKWSPIKSVGRYNLADAFVAGLTSRDFAQKWTHVAVPDALRALPYLAAKLPTVPRLRKGRCLFGSLGGAGKGQG